MRFRGAQRVVFFLADGEQRPAITLDALRK